MSCPCNGALASGPFSCSACVQARKQTPTCPCHGLAAGGPFSCQACQQKADRARSSNGGFETKGARFPWSTTRSGTLADSLASYATLSEDVLNVIGRWRLDTRSLADYGRAAPVFVRTCVHEAGHATACHALGLRITSVDPGPTPAGSGYNGMVRYDGFSDPTKELLLAVAGSAAESFACLPDHAPARELNGLDAIQADQVFDDLGITDDAVRHRAIEQAGAVVKGLLYSYAKGWNSLIWGLASNPTKILDGNMAHLIIAFGDLSMVGL